MPQVISAVKIQLKNIDKSGDFSRLKQILGRDKRVIKAYIGVIHENEQELVTEGKSGKYRIDSGLLDKLTLTTSIKNSMNSIRDAVKHDFKKKFQRISLNEIKECRDVAIGQYLSFLELKKIQKQSSLPKTLQGVRQINGRRYSLGKRKLSIMDSMDTNLGISLDGKNRVTHNSISIPIHLNAYAKNKLENGELRTVSLYKKDNKYYTSFAIQKETTPYQPDKSLKKAVLGIDLGINKTATTVLYTEDAILEERTWRQDEKISSLSKLEDRISNLQRQSKLREINILVRIFDYHSMKLSSLKKFKSIRKYCLDIIKQLKFLRKMSKDPSVVKIKLDKSLNTIYTILNSVNLKNLHKNEIKSLRKLRFTIANLSIMLDKLDKTSGIYKKLKKLKNKRSRISLDYDRKLVAELTNYISELSNKYNLSVAIGDISGIRNRGRKGNFKGRKYRKMLNTWSFFRFTEMLKFKMKAIGMERRLLSVRESWTSIMCFKCNTKGIRPKQSYFRCTNSSCKWQGNADVNGAINIAKRAIKYFKLTPKVFFGLRGLGRHLLVGRPKAQKLSQKQSVRSPILPRRNVSQQINL
ncbi:MAG: zinc ribbon domain-containing protein, partial [Candidatus Heimdallarchaeota archaeon]|nr:zinc ribbon domain-containing protein [Candidatus Heimdallarchaeota archaeon]